MFQTPFGNKKGISIIETIIVITIIVIALNSLLALVSFALGTSNLIKQNVRANELAKETMEIVRNFRDGTDWTVNGLGTLTVDINYYPRQTGTPPEWELIQGSETIEGFTRNIVFKNVLRNANSDIVDSGGVVDANTRKVIVDVSWTEKNRSHVIELTTYLTNWPR